jgi:ADP-ribosyl-[dinitrogen reductase] hydrolase
MTELSAIDNEIQPSSDHKPLEDRLVGTLLGTALGDALGLPAEGMSAAAIRRRFGQLDRFCLIGRTGFVSDDTEQSALLAESLVRHPDDPERCVRAFRRAMLGWFCRLPWGIGRATLRACLKIAVGISPSGVVSAGNGAAMRAAILGVFFHNQDQARETFGRAIAQVTHRDDRAIEGALYVAELAAACARATNQTPRSTLQSEARRVVHHAQLASAIDTARELALTGRDSTEAADTCDTSGFVVHTVAFATFVFLRHGDDPWVAITEAIHAGGDTDSIGAIVGGWMGALHGAGGLPVELVDRIHDGPFGPSHLRSLGQALAHTRDGRDVAVPGYSRSAALVRNLALYPVIVGHLLRRLLP